MSATVTGDTELTLDHAQARQLVEILDHTDRFLRDGDPAVHAAPMPFFGAEGLHPSVAAGAFIDAVSLLAAHLGAHLHDPDPRARRAGR